MRNAETRTIKSCMLSCLISKIKNIICKIISILYAWSQIMQIFVILWSRRSLTHVKCVELKNSLHLILISNIDEINQISQMRRREDLILLNRIITKSLMIFFYQHCVTNFAVKKYQLKLQKNSSIFSTIKLVASTTYEILILSSANFRVKYSNEIILANDNKILKIASSRLLIHQIMKKKKFYLKLRKSMIAWLLKF